METVINAQENQENPMTVYLVSYRDRLKDLAVSIFDDEALAKAAADATPEGHSAYVVRSEDSLRSWGPKLRVDIFNALAPEGTPPVKRFEDVAAACRRTFIRIADAKKAEPPRAAPKSKPEPAPAAPAEAATTTAANPPAPAPAAAGTTEDPMAAKKQKRTRKASNGGGKSRPRIPMDAKIELLVDKNPKRPTAAAYKRFELYRSGMKVETFLKNGGTPADLSWDRAHKFIKIVNP